MITPLLFLVGFPLLVSLALLATRSPRLRNGVVIAACAAVAAASLWAVVQFGGGEPVFFGLPGGALPGHALFAVEAAVGLFVVGLAVRHRRLLAGALAVAQLGVSAWLELSGRAPEQEAARLFCFDRLSMVMVLVVGLVGTLICVYALGYMRDYHRHHPQIAGRRTSFFFLLFVFLSAMFGLVTANDLPLLYLFWEITTVCSFLLIGYTGTRDVIGYAFRALEMNLLGGLGFAVALALLAGVPHGHDLAILSSGSLGAVAVPALALLALAGLTKSAQLPFSSWLLGAMYAPTPTSALLHSSTMVKAGVFLLLKLSPAMAGTQVGLAVATVGLLTFFVVSLTATTEQNTKKVLAYSTIGNLGLIVGCAGIATPEALWAGVMLVMFHAVAKSLLFLVVGTLENRLYTKDMEHFDHLLSRMPRVGLLALTGIVGMFVAPFGVVVAKWSALRAILAVPGLAGAVFLLAIAFGSAFTIFYWAKLLLKVLAMRRIGEAELAIESRVTRYEWLSEGAHAVGVVALAAGVGVLSEQVVTPWVLSAFGVPARSLFAMDGWLVGFLVVATLFLPAAAWWQGRRRNFDLGEIYAAGRTVNAAHQVVDARGEQRGMTSRNYYLEGLVNGARVLGTGTALGALVVSAMVLAQLWVKP